MKIREDDIYKASRPVFIFDVAAIGIAVAEWRMMVRLLKQLKSGRPLNRPSTYRWKTREVYGCPPGTECTPCGL